MNDDWLAPEEQAVAGPLFLEDILTPDEIRELARMALDDPSTETIRQRIVLEQLDELLARLGGESSVVATQHTR